VIRLQPTASQRRESSGIHKKNADMPRILSFITHLAFLHHLIYLRPSRVSDVGLPEAISSGTIIVVLEPD